MKHNNSSIYKNRWWDWPGIFLLTVLLTSAYSRLIATRWTEDLTVTRMVTYLALFTGLALGYSRFSRWWVAFFTLAYGSFVIPWRLGSTLGSDILWQERLTSIAGRLQSIITNLLQQRPVPDNLLFILLMAVVFWLLSAHAGYSLVRHANPWSIIIPSGIFLIIVHTYEAFVSGRLWYILLFLFFSLLIIVRLTYIKNRKRWEENNTYIPPYFGVDFVRIALIAIVILLLVTWTAPALANTVPAAQSAWQRIKQPWNNIRNTLDNAFASLRSTIGIVADYYGPNLALGRGNRLSDSIVFSVATPEEPPDGIRYYWRARVYDIYQDGWSTTLETTRAIEPDSPQLTFPDMSDNISKPYPFAFRIGVPLATLMTPQQATWVSRPVRMEYASNTDGSIDFASVRATPPLKAGETYQTQVSFNDITVDKMRNSGREYPEWVTSRYLQLPPTITNRTFQLANEIASGEETPYDIVVAVTNYLRSNIEYSDTVPALPLNRDLVDWFLFDLQRGFCNYYASAEIILLRALGIPSRLAVGYAQGEKMPDSDIYLVRQKDAHAWPEVYFPEIGWVEFEPTASQPVLVRPLGTLPDANPGQGNILRDDLPVPDIDQEDRLAEDDPGITETIDERNNLYYLILIALIVLFVILLIPFIRRRQLHKKLPVVPITIERGLRRLGIKPPAFIQKWALRASLSPIARAYIEINLALNRIGNHPSTTITPAERAAALVMEIPATEEPSNLLVSEYQQAIYSPSNSGNIEAARQAGKQIWILSMRELIERFIRKKSSAPYDGYRGR